MRYHPAFFLHSLPRLSRLTLPGSHPPGALLQLRFRAVVTSSPPVLSVLAAGTFGLVQPRSLSRLWRGAAFERSADNLATAVYSISRSRRRCRLPWPTFPLAGSVFEPEALSRLLHPEVWGLFRVPGPFGPVLFRCEPNRYHFLRYPRGVIVPSTSLASWGAP